MAECKSSKYSFVWRIKNFSLCYLKKGEKLSSPVFTPEIIGGSMWSIELYPKGNEKTSDFISCYLSRNENDNYSGNITIDYTVKMSGNNGDIIDLDTCENISFTPGFSWGWPEWIKISEVEDKMKKYSEDMITLTCDLVFKSKQFECTADTKFGECKRSFFWNIRIPDETPEEKLIAFSDSLEFEISVTAPGDVIKIVICSKTNKCSLDRILVCKMALLDLKGNEVNSRRATYTFDSDNNKFDYPLFITKKQLIDNKSTYIEDGCFSLWGEFSVSDGIEYSRILDSKTNNTSNISLQNLTEDFLNMFLQKKHTDVKLRVNKEIIPAHKSVLSARSPVFDAMFNQDMIESNTGIVEILDIDAKIMKSFLEYVYTGKVKNKDYINVKELLTLADRYQVIPLKEECADFLISSLSVRNVCDTFAIADLVTHEQLKKTAMEYIINHSSKILVSSEWYELLKNNPRLASDVYSNIAVNFKFMPINKTIRDVCDIFAIADLVTHEQLKKIAMEYIINHSLKVLVSSEWYELLKNNPRLALDVY